MSALTPFRFAVQGGPFTDPDTLAAHARHVESLGYDELYTSDHIGGVDPFAPLLVAALATTRLRVGTLVLNNELYSAVGLARTAATIDTLTGGRLVLGIGTGYAQSEHDAIGVPLRPPGRRVTRLEETLRVVRSLLDTGRAHLTGREVTVAVDDLGVRPAQPHVPLLVGGDGRRVVAAGAACADIFQFTGIVHGPGGEPTGAGFDLAHLAERVRWLDVGGRRDHIERSVLVQASFIGPAALDPDTLAERFQLPVETVADTPFLQTGSPEQVVDRLERHRELLGLSHYVVRAPDEFAPIVAALSGR